MSITTIQALPVVLNVSIFQNLEFKDLMNAMKVCKTWKRIIESNCFLSATHSGERIGNLVIDIPRDLVIDKNLTVTGMLLIRAKNIYSKPGICLSGVKVTLVADQIRHLGPIEGEKFVEYSNESHIEGPMLLLGDCSCSLKYYSAKPDFWSSLVRRHTS